jgi:large subunit ribosomal protein L10
LAISKGRKNEVIQQYVEWLDDSQGLFFTEYTGLSMKQMDDLRSKTREAGGEFHVIKNTLAKVAFEQAGYELPGSFLEGSTAVAFAFKDVAGMAKVISEFSRTNEFVKIKGGFLDKQVIPAVGVKTLAELPPLPVMRAQLLGTILAPASQLVRTLAEPARQLAAVFKAFADKDTSAVTA